MKRKSKYPSKRIDDREEQILDSMFRDRNDELRRACRKIIKGAQNGLAIFESLLETDTAARLAKRGNIPDREFLNLQGYLWLFELELASLLDDYIKSRGERRWLYARLLYLSLVESSKTLRRVYSITYRRVLMAALGNEIKPELDELHRFIHSAHEELRATYGEIRDRAVAHRDPDIEKVFQVLGSLSAIDIKDFAWEVLTWCAAMEAVQQRYLTTLKGTEATQ